MFEAVTVLEAMLSLDPHNISAATADRYFPAVFEFMRVVFEQKAPDETALRCFMCDTRFWLHEPPQFYLVLHAHHHRPTEGTVSAICSSCRRAHDDGAGGMQRAVLAAYQRNIVHDLRVISPSEPGHA
jgi:hypothetical protein